MQQRAQFVAAIILSFSLLFLAAVSAHARSLNRHGGPGDYLHPVQLEARDSRHQIASQHTPVNPVGGSANSVAGNPALSARGKANSADAAGNKNLQRIRTNASGAPSQSNTTATGYGQQSNNPATGNHPRVPSVIVHDQGLRRGNHGFNKQIQVQSDATATGTRNYQPVDQRIPPHGKANRITMASDVNINHQASVNANGGQPDITVTNNRNNQANVNGNNQQPLENANGGQPNTISTDARNDQHTPVNAIGNNLQSLVNAYEGKLNGKAASTESSQPSGGNISKGQLNNSRIDTGNSQPTSGSTSGGQPNNNAGKTGNSQPLNSATGVENSQPTSGGTSGGQPNNNAAGTETPTRGNTSVGQLNDSETEAGNSQPTSVSTSGGQPNNNAASTKNSQSGGKNTSRGQLNNSETEARNSQPTSGSARGGQSNENAAGTENSQSSGENKSLTGAENSPPTSGDTSEGHPNNNWAAAGNSEPSGNTSEGQLNNSGAGAGNPPSTSGSTSGGQPKINAVGTGNSKPSGGNTSEDHSNHTAAGSGKFQQASEDDFGTQSLLQNIAHGIGSLMSQFRNHPHDHTHDSDDYESEIVQEFLEAHNVIRKIFQQPLYTWDTKLARLANEYATKRHNDCAMIHSPWEYGENLAYGGSPKWSALQAVNLWFNESQFYDFKTNSCFGDWKKCGHFTQMVWRDTVSLGCARRPCFRNGREGVIIVCEYSPPGNHPGENPFETNLGRKKK